MALRKTPIHVLLVAGAATLLPLSTLPAASVAGTAHAGSAPVTVASGLDNPRQLTFRKGVGLLVAEAGAGGDGPCVPGPEGAPVCYGATGAITRLRGGQQVRVVKRLPSLANRDGSAASGPFDVIPYGDQRIAFTIGLGGDPRLRADLPRKGRLMAHLVAAKVRHGKQRGALLRLRDLGAFEVRKNPHPAAVDSNPTALVRAKKKFVVTDAGGNDLLRVHKHRRPGVLAVFPDQSYAGSPEFQAVPTSVVRGPDGAYYVSQLTGFPFPVGAANIWRVVPGKPPTVYASGLTNVTDLGWHRGQLFAVQIADAGLAAGGEGPPLGSVRRIVPGSTAHPALVSSLVAPYGVTFRASKAYVTVCSVCPDAGEVVSVLLG